MRILLTEIQLRKIIKSILTEKKWSDLHAPKGQAISLSADDFIDDDPDLDMETQDDITLADEIFDLIQNAYADVELAPGTYGNIKVRSPADLPGGYTIMSAADFDEDPQPDYFRGAKMRGEREKLGVVGHDGSAIAVQKYLEDTAHALLTGAIAEMSGKIAHIMITRHGIPAVTNHQRVEALLGKKVGWIGKHPDEKYASRYGPAYDGWYTRDIEGPSGGAHMKILLGGV